MPTYRYVRYITLNKNEMNKETYNKFTGTTHGTVPVYRMKYILRRIPIFQRIVV